MLRDLFRRTFNPLEIKSEAFFLSEYEIKRLTKLQILATPSILKSEKKSRDQF